MGFKNRYILQTQAIFPIPIFDPGVRIQNFVFSKLPTAPAVLRPLMPFQSHWRRCCWIEKQNQNMRIGFHAVLCPVSCLLCPVSCVHSIKLGSTHTELCSPVNLHCTVQYFTLKEVPERKISKLLLSLICAPKNKYSPSCGLYASPHLPLGLLAFHP